MSKKEVERVDIPSTDGDMGILANHVPTIQQLKPGVIEITGADGKSTKYFGILSKYCSWLVNKILSFWRIRRYES